MAKKTYSDLIAYINQNWEMHPYEGRKAIERMDHSHYPLQMANAELYDKLSDLINEFAELEAQQFQYYTPESKERIWGLFGEQDTLAHFEPLFLEHYTHSYHFTGAHTPTEQEVKTWYVPLIEKLNLLANK